MSVANRFIKYVQIDTQSNPDSGLHPSTNKQFDLAHILVEELKELGLSSVRLDEHCYVYAELPANAENLPSLGLIAHIDTEPVCSGKGVKPKVVSYRGGDIQLEHGTLSPDEFPSLLQYVGQDLIVTGGDTLLGADDKAGIAEIMTAVEYLLSHPEIKHGKIGVAFTPDEEIGEGASLFDVKGFGCDFAYTVDGGGIGDFGYETFNAAEAVVNFVGKNIHPGSAKGKMVNCTLLAGEFLSSLPEDERPENTEGKEGFYHVESVKAEVETGEVKLIIRDHSMERFISRKNHVQAVCEKMQQKYGKERVFVKIRDQYFNCLEKIKPHFHLVENARKAFAMANIPIFESAVRGGTDGCTLSFMGLPCPNLFTGGHNAHSVKEYIPIPSMEKAVEVMINLVKIYGQN